MSENRRLEASVAADDRGPVPDKWGGENTESAGVLLYMRIATFLWCFGSLIWPEMGDRRRERESPARGERCSGLCYGENVSTVHRCR